MQEIASRIDYLLRGGSEKYLNRNESDKNVTAGLLNRNSPSLCTLLELQKT